MAKTSNKSKPKPFATKAGTTRHNNARRYDCGGKLSKKSK